MTKNLNIPYVAENQLPSFQVVKEGLTKFSDLAPTLNTYLEIKSAFFECIPTLPQLIHPDGSLRLPIYRVSINDHENFDVNNFVTFSHPPPEFCGIGRCNLEGHPVFYASISEDTALHEKRKADGTPVAVGDEVYISTWYIEDGCEFHYSQFVFGDGVSISEIVSELNESNLAKVNEISKPYSTDKQTAFRTLLEKFGEYFISDNYAISSFLCHNLLYDGRGKASIVADAILYPSVQKNLTDYNVAIHPEFVKDHSRLREVRKVRVKSISEAGTHVELLESGVLDEYGRIAWVTSKFSTKNMHLKILGIRFKGIEPDPQHFSNKNTYLHDKVAKSLEDICWEYLNQNQLRVLTILSRDVQQGGLKQKKELVLHLPGDLVSILVNDFKYPIDAIQTNIEYEVAVA